MNRFFPIAAFVVATMGCCGAAPPTASSETAKTADALIAVEHHWTQAEVHGDAAYVSALLLPQYESVDANGTANPKSAIVASAIRNGKSDKMARLVARYMIEHPYGTLVHIQGDTAVVTFYALKRGPKKGVESSDIFVYVAGPLARRVLATHAGHGVAVSRIEGIFKAGSLAVSCMSVVCACGGGSPKAGPVPTNSPRPTPTFSASSAPAASPTPKPTPTPTLTPVPTTYQTLFLFYNTTHFDFYPNSLTVSVNGVTTFVGTGSIVCDGLQLPPGPYGCSTSLYVPNGTTTFFVRVFPNATASGTPTAVGSATVPVGIGSVTTKITMNGVPTSISLTLTPTSVTTGRASTVVGAVTVLDNTGSTPLLPSMLSDPDGHPLVATISDSDTSGATVVSPAEFSSVSPPPSGRPTSEPVNVSISYDGSSIGSPAFTAAIPGVPAATATLTVAPSSTPTP